MGILKSFQEKGSTLTSLKGGTPAIPNFKTSKLHNTYSSNGEPNIAGVKQTPSILDLDCKTPAKYSDNLPK
jgi:hypothetical protein